MAAPPPRSTNRSRPASSARMRRRVMGFVVERIAEQRLLWHLRKATEVCARIPADMQQAEADRVIRAMLKKDADHHLKWMLIDFALLVLSAPLIVRARARTCRASISRSRSSATSSRCAAPNRVCRACTWTFTASEDLAELREAMRLGCAAAAAPRARARAAAASRASRRRSARTWRRRRLTA